MVPKELIDWRTIPEAHNTQYREAMGTYHFARDFAKGVKVLDAGCAYGYGADFLASYASRVTGVDFNAQAIRFARKHYQKDNLEFFVVDLTKLEFPESSFDLVCLFEILRGAEKLKPVLAELKRIVTQKGILLATVQPNDEYPAERWQKIFSDSGFIVHDSYGLYRPKIVYELEEQLSRIRSFDFLGARRVIPRQVISWFEYWLARHRGVTPAAELAYDEFKVSKDEAGIRRGVLFIAGKPGAEG